MTGSERSPPPGRSDSEDVLLRVTDLHAGYEESEILNGISFSVKQGEVASVIGRNGAGKTTTFRAIMGVLRPRKGRVMFAGEEVTGMPDHRLTRRGLRYVPEDRRLFPDLSVIENLRVGQIGSTDRLFTVDEIFEMFPRLDERRNLEASHLSGGEQQMLAIARALVGRTEVLLLDEPTEGLAPQIVEDVIEVIDRISDTGVTIILSEQNINVAMEAADHHHVIDKGQIVFSGPTDDLEADEAVQDRHLSVGVDVSEQLFD